MIVKGNNTESFIFYAKKDGSIRKFLTANALYFIFTAAGEVEADAILIWRSLCSSAIAACILCVC